jgi:hypothetical protein
MSSPVSDCVRALWPEPKVDSPAASHVDVSLISDEELEHTSSHFGDSSSDTELSALEEDSIDSDLEILVWDEELQEMCVLQRESPSRAAENRRRLYLPADVVHYPAPGVFDPDFVTPVKEKPSHLIRGVATNNWRFIWAMFLSDTFAKWDVTFHHTRFSRCFHDLYKFLDPDHAEMKATFYLIDLAYYKERPLDMKKFQECLALLDSRLDWNKEVDLPSRYMKFVLRSLGLPEFVLEKIWNDHLRHEIVVNAIIRCAMDAAASEFEEMSHVVENRLPAYEVF